MLFESTYNRHINETLFKATIFVRQSLKVEQSIALLSAFQEDCQCLSKLGCRLVPLLAFEINLSDLKQWVNLWQQCLASSSSASPSCCSHPSQTGERPPPLRPAPHPLLHRPCPEQFQLAFLVSCLLVPPEAEAGRCPISELLAPVIMITMVTRKMMNMMMKAMMKIPLQYHLPAH